MLSIPTTNKRPIKHLSSPTESFTTDKVYHQMLPDFPGIAIQWVKHCSWEGPRSVPLNSIDTSNRQNWVASHEPEKVKIHQDLIKQGVSKPIILARLPGHDKLFIVDAHHRFLAYEALDENPTAYIGLVPSQYVEAAITAHSKQYSGSSRLEGPSDPGN
jgi:hypothetical protein